MRPERAPRLSLDLLRGFRSAARRLSFTEAARELCLTQSAVSHQVKALEEQLGTPLFARVNRTLRLTLAGEQLYRATDEALSLIDLAAEQVASAGRTLSITTTVPFASMWLGPRQADFARRYPDVRLRVVASNDSLDIARERIDVALRYVPVGATPPTGEVIFDYEAFPVCSPALMRQAVPSIEAAADLARQVFLELETVVNGRPWYDWPQWLDAMKIRNLKPTRMLRFSHYDQVIATALSGGGLAIGKWPHLASHLQQNALVAPLGDVGVVRLGSFYFIVGGSAASGPVESFRTWLRAQADSDIKKRGKHMSGRGPSRTAGRRIAATRR